MTRELEVAIAAAEVAGEVLRNGFGQRHEVRYKGEVDLVFLPITPPGWGRGC